MTVDNERWQTAGRREKVLPLREQARVIDGWLTHRLETVLPEIMKREGFDMWLVIAREYNEDPVLLSLLPATSLSARRLSMLVFFRGADGKLERLTVSRYPIAPFYAAVWDPDKEDQWAALARIVRERSPRCIGIDVSETFAFGDGLTASLHRNLIDALGPELAGRTKGAERLAVGWLERRSEPEKQAYPGIVAIAHSLIADAFSSRICHPGVSTADDLVWWFRQRINDLGLSAWFQPTVDIQRQGGEKVASSAVILPGDVLHCDVGLHYLGLATDTQQMAYVLKLGEDAAPAGLTAALHTGNRLQDILAGECVEGRSGNDILASALARARAEGIKPSIYTHPLGFHGHGAGPTIGLWDAQQGVPGRGDYPLLADTCHAMELNIRQAVPEWGGQEVQMSLEQDILFTGGRVHFLAGRQTELHLIS